MKRKSEKGDEERGAETREILLIIYRKEITLRIEFRARNLSRVKGLNVDRG